MTDAVHIEVSSSSSNTSIDSNSSEGQLWDVQEILAERFSASGGKELLVVWKASWIPHHCMVADGPVMRHFTRLKKISFVDTTETMRVVLPIEPGSSLAKDRHIFAMNEGCPTNSSASHHPSPARAVLPHRRLRKSGTETGIKVQRVQKHHRK